MSGIANDQRNSGKIEILVVLDGSTDRSEEIALEFSRVHPESVRVISKPNGGHGSAINTGMDNAAGEYVKVLDSDDWVNRKGFIRLVEGLEKYDTDIVWSNFFWVYEPSWKEKRPEQTSVPGSRIWQKI